LFLLLNVDGQELLEQFLKCWKSREMHYFRKWNLQINCSCRWSRYKITAYK